MCTVFYLSYRIVYYSIEYIEWVYVGGGVIRKVINYSYIIASLKFTRTTRLDGYYSASTTSRLRRLEIEIVCEG